MTVSKRPLSPHIQIWKWTPTMAMSILNRATGIANAVGMIAIVWWLLAAASGADCYAAFTQFASSPLGKFMFIGWTFSVFVHLFGGIRHFIMDMGYLFTIKANDLSVYLIVIASTILTAITWLTILGS